MLYEKPRSLLDKYRLQIFWFALILLVITAITGIIVLELGQAALPGRYLLPGTSIPTYFDADYLLNPAYAVLNHHGAYPWYGSIYNLAYPPQYVFLFVPLALLPRDIAEITTLILTAIGIVVFLIYWCRVNGKLALWFWPLLLSVPVFHLLHVDQIFTVIGLTTLCLALYASQQNHWYLVGFLLAIALIRPFNVIELLPFFIVITWSVPKNLLKAAVGGLVFFAPLTALSFLWDPKILTYFLASAHSFNLDGPPRILHDLFGGVGPYLGLGALTLLGCLLAYKHSKKQVNLDDFALVLGISALVATAGGLYIGVFVFPALSRLALRAKMFWVPWFCSFTLWGVILLFSPQIVSGNNKVIFGLTTSVLALSLLSFLLLVQPRQRNISEKLEP